MKKPVKFDFLDFSSVKCREQACREEVRLDRRLAPDAYLFTTTATIPSFPAYTGQTDNLMEGLYLRTESQGVVTGRAKLVRPEFIEKVRQSMHWQQQAMVPNLLVEGTDIWS